MSAELAAQFTPENFGEWCREKFDRFTADPHDIRDAGDFPKAAIVGYVQSLPDADTNRPLLVMAVHAGEKINERTSRRLQFDFARRQLQAAMDRPPAKVKGLFTQGLFAFYDDAGNFRLSLITGRAEGRRLVYGDFKRQSFFVVPDPERNKTFRARMASPFGAWKNLVEAFSVETLTKEFYNSLFAWYERAMDPASKVSFPNDLARDDDDRQMLAEHLIRLITRLMFVWFIRQKKLVPQALFDETELKRLLKDFDPLSPKQDNYYRAILQNLFFATLNREIGERAFAPDGSFQENREHFGIKILYRYPKEFACSQEKVLDLFRTVPFLNGGLFECLDKGRDYQDGFSRNEKQWARIPNNLFFDDDGLITLFARYDFTVDENSPNDADVALDPELLGKVFENLLGAYNPETKQTARKQSGSFCTPREIVNYMVDESLKAHLLTNVGQAFLPAQTAQRAQTRMSAPHPQCGAGIPACLPDSQIAISRRRLPHWHMDGAIYWVCFRLADSIPLDKLRAWQAERALWCRANAEPWNEGQWQEYNRLFGDRYEEWLDAGMGSRALARGDVRKAVADCLMRFHGDRLLIHAAVIMPTHVHALIEPLPIKKGGADIPVCASEVEEAGKNACHTLPSHDLSALLQGIKGASARAANKILGTTGTSFWMDESYDHIVRSERQYRHFLRYIGENPIKAGLRSDEYWLTSNVGQTPNVGQAFLPAQDAQTGMSAPPLKKKTRKSVLTEDPDLA